MYQPRQHQACSSACFGESALEAWLGCLPQGYSADAARISDCMHEVMTQVLDCTPRHNVDDVRQMFVAPTAGAEPMFVRLLRPHGGRVHFLRFWKAFGDVACLAGAPPSEGLQAEIETLRDQILRRAECEPPPRGPALDGILEGARFWAVIDEVHRAASMSLSPRFWQRVATSLGDRASQEHIGFDELAGIMLSWVSEATLAATAAATAAESVDVGCFGGVAGGGCAVDSAAERHGGVGLPVLLHIYDVSSHENIQRLNQVLAFERSPVKFGGVFHAGVEVNGLEWSFSYSPSRTRPGVSCLTPMKHPHHHYRETVYCGRTQLSFAGICRIISDMLEEYPGSDYHLLRRNCCHFADDFLRRLGLEGIPAWVHRLARLGANIDAALRAAQAVRDAVTVGCIGGSEEQRGRRARTQRGHRTAQAKVPRRPLEPCAAPWHSGPQRRGDLEREMGVFGRVSMGSDYDARHLATPPRSSAASRRTHSPAAPATVPRSQKFGVDLRLLREFEARGG